MKKLSIIFAVAVFATIGLISCEKKQDLKGTNWKSEVYYLIRYDIMSFTSDHEGVSNTYSTENDSLIAEIPFSYTYNPPNIRLIVQGKKNKGKVKGNEMTFTKSTGGIITYTKQ